MFEVGYKCYFYGEDAQVRMNILTSPTFLPSLLGMLLADCCEVIGYRLLPKTQLSQRHDTGTPKRGSP